MRPLTRPPVFGLPPDVVQATLGDVGLKDVTDLAVGVRLPYIQFLASPSNQLSPGSGYPGHWRR